MLKKTLLFLAFCALTLQINMFNKMELTTKNGAMCLDGSPFAIYTYQPDPLDFDVIANKLLIFFEETDFGWCIEEDLNSTLEKCHKFATDVSDTSFGSSKNYGGS